MHKVGDFDRDATLKDNHSLYVRHFEVNRNTQKCLQVMPVYITRIVVTEHPTEIWVSLCWQLLNLVMIAGCGEKTLVPSSNSVVFASGMCHTVAKKKVAFRRVTKC